MKDIIMFEKITCPKCKKEYPDIEYIIKCNIRLCYCGSRFTWVKHIIILSTLMTENNTTHTKYYYEMKEL